MQNKPIDRIMNRYFSEEITIEEANDEIEEYLKVRDFDAKTINLLNRRKDSPGKKGRSYAQFFADISVGVRKEHSIFLEWVKFMEQHKFDVRWEKYGTDAIGLAFIEDNDPRPDYLISVNKSPFFVVDVKTCPVDNINTFKKGDLKNYLKYDGSILVLMGKATPKESVLKSFSFYGPKAVKKLSKFEGRIYFEYARNKKAVRISVEKDFKKKDAHITFKEMQSEKLVDIIKVTDTKIKADGPLRTLIEKKYDF